MKSASPAIVTTPSPVITPPRTGDHNDAADSDGHNGASRGPMLVNTASSPATKSAAATAAAQGGSTPASGWRCAFRAYHAPIPDVTPNSSAAIKAPTSAPSSNIDTCDETGSAVPSCIRTSGQALASAMSASTNESAATILTARVSQRPLVQPI